MKLSGMNRVFAVAALILLLISSFLRRSAPFLSDLCCAVGILPVTVFSVADAAAYSKLSKEKKRKYRQEASQSFRLSNRILWGNPYVWMIFCCAGCIFIFVQIVRTISAPWP